MTSRSILAVNDTFRITALEILIHLLLISSDTRFVCKRPHNYADVVLVSFVGALTAVHIRLGPFGTVAEIIPRQELVSFMSLNVVFVADVKSETVAHRQESGIIGIMARAYHIYVVRLHYQKVVPHVFYGSSRTENGMAVVAVDAACLDLSAVYKYYAVFYLQILKADYKGNIFFAAM